MLEMCRDRFMLQIYLLYYPETSFIFFELVQNVKKILMFHIVKSLWVVYWAHLNITAMYRFVFKLPTCYPTCSGPMGTIKVGVVPNKNKRHLYPRTLSRYIAWHGSMVVSTGWPFPRFSSWLNCGTSCAFNLTILSCQSLNMYQWP